MADTSGSTLNSIFSAHLDSPEGKEKLAAVGADIERIGGD